MTRLDKETEVVLKYRNKEVFKRLLMFGDRDQITALKNWNLELKIIEDRDLMLRGNDTKVYLVRYTCLQEEEQEIDAVDEEHAKVILFEDTEVEDIISVEEL